MKPILIIRVRTPLRWEYLGEDLRLTPIPRRAATWDRDSVAALAALASAQLRAKHWRAELVEVEATPYPTRVKGVMLAASIDTLEYLAHCLARAEMSDPRAYEGKEGA